MNNKTLKLGMVLTVLTAAAVGLAQNFNPAKRLAKEVVKKAEGKKSAPKPQPATQPATPKKTLTVDEIVNRTNYVSYYQGADGRAKVRMTVVDKQGGKRHKELTILRWDKPAAKEKAKGDEKPETKKSKQKAPDEKSDRLNCGDQKFYVYFQSPPDDNKTTFLVWKYLEKDDDRWLYLPNLDLVKRISATDTRTSFVGSHFFYEDVSGRNIESDKHELLKTDETYYVLRNTPKKPDTVEFAYYDMYILKEAFIPVHIWYYDRNGRKYRSYSVSSWERDKTFGYATVRKARMDDSDIGGYTELEYRNVKYNIDLPEELFTERFLKRTPYRYLK